MQIRTVAASTWKQLLELAVACGRHTLEVLPEKAGEAAATGGKAAVGLAGFGALPATILAAGVGEIAIKHFENRARPGALANLFRTSILHALKTCPPPQGILGAGEDDLALVELWEKGFEQHGDDDPGWAALLEEAVPDQVIRAVGVQPGDESSYWPSLRALLERCTRWFQPTFYESPLRLSPFLEEHLARKVTPAFIAHFLPELTSGAKQDEFREAVLVLLRQANSALAPLDPLRTLDQMRDERPPSKTVDFLIARYRAFPYIGRKKDLEQLWEWLNSPEPVSLQVVIGRGGAGKTRFAYEFLEEIERRAPWSWHAGFVDLDEFGKLDPERFRYWRGRKQTLIVIDYAASATEILTQQVLPRLYNYCLAGEGSAPRLRFLLLERAADERNGWYRDLLLAARERDKEMFPSPPLRLSALGPDERIALLEEALRVLFAARDGEPVSVPADLAARLIKGPALDPLVLGMAALVADERRGFSPTFDLDRLDLARAVAKNEERRLNNLARSVRQDSFLLLHMAAFVTLTGSLTASQLQEACETEREHVAPHSHWAEDLYSVLTTKALPPEKDGAVDPVLPDIVGEAFIVHVLSGEQHQAEETIVRASVIRAREVTRTLRRIVQDFAPPVPTEAAPDQKWALDLLTHLLRTRAGSLSDEDFWAIRAELPLQSLSMASAAGDFYRAVVASRPSGLEEGTLDPVALGARESQALYARLGGHRAEALGMMGPVVRMWRKLAESNPDAFLPDLAMSLNNLANRQSEMGQRAEALRSIAEAVAIQRKLAESKPDAFLPNLAMSLNNLANRQSEMGQRAEALRSIAEAVAIRRALAESNPDAFLPNLAASLNNQATSQSEMGQRAEALRSIGEAVGHYRKLAESNAGAFLPDLAMSLNNQAAMQSEMGQRAEALHSIAEAVGHYRKLAESNPDAFLPNLAASLNNQGTSQSEMGQRAEALRSIAEAVSIRRRLAESNPDAFLPDLAGSLNNQATMQSEMGQRAEALRSIAEAVSIRRKLAESNPDAFLPNLAKSYLSWGRILISNEPPAAALEFGEGLRLIAPLALKLPEAYLPTALALARDYLEASEKAQIEPEADLVPLLVQIAELIGGGGEDGPPDAEAAGA